MIYAFASALWGFPYYIFTEDKHSRVFTARLMLHVKITLLLLRSISLVNFQGTP